MCVRARIKQGLLQASDALELRSELLSPLSDYVGLINREHVQSTLPGCVEERPAQTTDYRLRGRKKNWDAAILDGRPNGRLCFFIQASVVGQRRQISESSRIDVAQ
jgi:hypothetical protein